MKSSFFRCTMPCSPNEEYRRFGGISPPSSGIKSKPRKTPLLFAIGLLLGLLFDLEDGCDGTPKRLLTFTGLRVVMSHKTTVQYARYSCEQEVPNF
jgi:hypothetical protein